MKNEPRAIALLRSANPVRVEPAAVGSPQAQALFQQIIGQPRAAQDGRRGRPWLPRSGGAWRSSAGIAVGGAGISAVAAAIIVAVFSGSAVAPAFAGWSATPTVAGTQQITAVTNRCGLSKPVLVEQRGPFTAALFTSRSGGSACVVGPSMYFVGSIGGVQAPDNRFKPGQIGMAAAAGSTRGQGFVLLSGRVGSAVRSIVIHRSDHVDVTASIRHGWYLAWWPTRGARATNATVTTANGKHSVALPLEATSAPPSCPRAHPGCMIVTSGPETNGPGSAGVPGPPMVGQQLSRPFHRLLLFSMSNASRVLVCFHPPSNGLAALRANGPTGPCARATLLSRLPNGLEQPGGRYPVQRNLLEVFPHGVWSIRLPARVGSKASLKLLIVASGSPRFPQARNEMTVRWG